MGDNWIDIFLTNDNNKKTLCNYVKNGSYMFYLGNLNTTA